MTDLITYFETISSLHRALILAGGIAIFWIIETTFPLFKFKNNKIEHAKINIFFTLTTIIVNFCFAFLLVYIIQFTTNYKFGLLHLLPKINFWIFTLIGLLLLDFIGAYLAHFTEHKIKFLWKFHLVHHTDICVDTTTANRHHPGESVIRFLFTGLGLVLVGAPMWMLFLYQALSVLLSQFNHANVLLPKKVDHFISYFLVSPDMHKVHHHYKMPYTDTNYGNIFSVWDRLFGTFSTINRADLIYGLDTHSNENDVNKVVNLLKIPFKKVDSVTE